ncbi:A/G-specific DNA-adenine glycosylase [Anaerocolumna xylanovorans DSM 12503]|uniref:Adenine DNA glycosylase n=2 Tax=Anaerocolumna TaxID=1843210 RepID=A0A1M7YJ08_9FIRM|nr:A/G-specific DNA-adenine glycosylase [Anaerocolumna xylanovorans DSM 12503]
MKYDYSPTIEFLLDWYGQNARILPWRENPKPYYVWISEIMLQQTRVEAVKAYFERFINALPDISSLADVEEEKLLKLWEGLGYYNRVRNLQKTARILVSEYDGKLPKDYTKLLTLPGIGSYTAGAIASIAFHIAEPAVDGNVLRVMMRVSGSFDDITEAKVKKSLEEDLRAVMPKDRPGDFNQAVMELGATVCIPVGRPLCNKCPLMHLCQAFKNRTEDKIPVKKEKKPRKIQERTVFLLESGGRYVLNKREKKGLLAGMMEFPGVDEKLSPLMAEEYLTGLGYAIEGFIPLGEAKHIFSHVEWHMTGYLVHVREIVAEDSRSYRKDKEESKTVPVWALKREIEEIYSLPSAFDYYRKFIV